MFLVRKGQNDFFRFGALSRFQGLVHAVVSRGGGQSEPPYDSMNLSHGVGDNPACVEANRERLRQSTGGGIHVYSRQIHGTSIHEITSESGSGAQAIQTLPTPADALITDVPGVRLLIQTADCQAVMLFDPIRRVVANVHCGWRGSVADIIGLTVKRMVSRFGCRPAGMVAAIGPSLGPCCAEFIHFKTEIPAHLWPFRVGVHHFDFWRISRHQLVTAGLDEANVYASAICTRCNPQLFYSYRAARRTGRFAALIGIEEVDGARRRWS